MSDSREGKEREADSLNNRYVEIETLERLNRSFVLSVIRQRIPQKETDNQKPKIVIDIWIDPG